MTRTHTPAPLAPLDAARTRRAAHARTGRLETWEAGTQDGLWLFERTEDAGTPWRITHVPTRGWLFAPSLARARRWVASGWAWREVQQQLAESRMTRCGWRSPWGGASVCTQLAVPGSDRCGRHAGR